MPETQLYPLIQKTSFSEAVYQMAVQQIVDFAAFRVHGSDLLSELLLIEFKGAALEQGDLQRVNAQNLFQVLIVLIQITEVYAKLILQKPDADGADGSFARCSGTRKARKSVCVTLRFSLVAERELRGTPCQPFPWGSGFQDARGGR